MKDENLSFVSCFLVPLVGGLPLGLGRMLQAYISSWLIAKKNTLPPKNTLKKKPLARPPKKNTQKIIPITRSFRRAEHPKKTIKKSPEVPKNQAPPHLGSPLRKLLELLPGSSSPLRRLQRATCEANARSGGGGPEWLESSSSSSIVQGSLWGGVFETSKVQIQRRRDPNTSTTTHPAKEESVGAPKKEQGTPKKKTSSCSHGRKALLMPASELILPRWSLPTSSLEQPINNDFFAKKKTFRKQHSKPAP